MLHRYQLAKPGSNLEIVTPDFVLEGITLSWFTVCQQRGYAEDVEISVQEIKKTMSGYNYWLSHHFLLEIGLKFSGPCSSCRMKRLSGAIQTIVHQN
ncbi:Testis-Expressed Protein 13A [Manis pentadactyla]|nr:Testis-Expressed Protein 13A [Manis pentadactyla]